MSKVILIRGNSGSGKTVVATELHEVLGSGCLLISQDYVRRQMLKVKDRPFNLAIGLIQTMLIYGIENCEYTIVEGILAKNKYGEMLIETLEKADQVFSYYYDLPFEETYRRHLTKEQTDFGKERMKSWYTEKDFLGIENEKIISKEVSKEELVEQILADLNYQQEVN